jgi:hypothetical protein
MIDARTQDTWILTVAMGLIATVAVSVELFGGRYDDYERRKGKTESPHASENEAVN